jgi:hypothetical protein
MEEIRMRNARKHRTTLLAFAAAGLLLSAMALPAQESSDDKAASPHAIQLKSRTFTPSPGVEPELRGLDLKSRKGTLGLIQFDAVPDDAVRAQLEGLGVTLLQYVPNNTWIAKLPIDIDRAAGVYSVRWVGRLLADDKLPDSLREKSIVALDQGKPVLTLDVEAVQGSLDEAAARVTALGGSVLERDEALAVMRVTLPRKSVRALAESDAVIWLSPEMPLALYNNFIRTHAQVNTVHQAPYGLTGAGVQLGIWDGGEIFAHGDFGTRLNVIETGTISAHATHVAGTMAGSGLRSNLFAPGPGLPAFPVNHFRGVAYGADIIGYDFVAGALPYSEHNAAIVTHGIDNSQNSWGGDISTANANCALMGNYETYARNYDLIVNGTFGRKIPVVFAVGNDRNDGDCGMSAVAPFLNYSIVPPPATAKNIIGVGAINADNGTMTDFSNWGPLDDGRLRPDIVTGGGNAGSNPFPAIISTSVTNGYAGSSGTSMAAPAVSGAVGLLLQRYRAICPATGTDPLPSTLKAVLIHTARDLDDATSYFNRGPDYASGYGSLDVTAAVDMLPFHREDSVSHTGTDTFNIVVTRMTDLKVTLVWDDPAAASGAAVALINDLDLELEDPLGNFHRPWILNPASPAAAATRNPDNRNVVEQVVVDSVTGLLAGTWKIHVRGTNVPSGPQSYSLVTQHLPMTSVSCAGASTAADPWAKDKEAPLVPVDPGTEPNPDTTWIAQSNEVWIRYDDLNNTGHLNPEVGQPNYITTRVRNRGTATANTIRVMFYIASSSTGIGWPAGWTLVGEKTIVNLPPGGSKIVNTRWDPPATGHYCLYIRLLSDQDPMTFPEGSSVDVNTRNNNNIIWRNVDAYNVFSEGPIVVLFGNTLRAQSATLRLDFNLTPDARGRTLLDVGRVQVRLDERLAEVMAAAGIEPRFPGFERIDDLTLEMVRPDASFPELPLGPGEEYPIEIEVLPFFKIWPEEAYILNIIQGSVGAATSNKVDANAGSVHLYVRDIRATQETPLHH